MTELILHNFKEKMAAAKGTGTRPAIHELTPARTASEKKKNPFDASKGKVVSMHIV